MRQGEGNSADDLVRRLRATLTMSMFADRDGLYGALNTQRYEAADLIERLRTALEESQAREAALRDVLQQCDDAMAYMSEYDIPIMLPENVKAALATPPDDSALRERIAREVAAEREACAQVADAERAEFTGKADDNNGRESDFAFGSVNSAERIAYAIRERSAAMQPERSEGCPSA